MQVSSCTHHWKSIILIHFHDAYPLSYRGRAGPSAAPASNRTMEWSGRPLTEELCVAVLRHLEPCHLASFSACCNAARRLAASDALWRPLYDHVVQAAVARQRRRGGASSCATGANARCTGAMLVGGFKERYRKLRADKLRDQIWSARQKAATAEGAHTEALRQCEDAERAVHRTRATVVSEQRAKRQRLAGAWHPAAVQRQLSGCSADTHASTGGTLPTLDVESAGSTTTEQTLRKLEAHSDARRKLSFNPVHSVVIGEWHALVGILGIVGCRCLLDDYSCGCVQAPSQVEDGKEQPGGRPSLPCWKPCGHAANVQHIASTPC